MMDDTTYNGYTNYETWYAVTSFAFDWANNQLEARISYSNIEVLKEDMVAMFIEHLNPDKIPDHAWWWIERITGKIDWDEIARVIVSDDSELIYNPNNQ